MSLSGTIYVDIEASTLEKHITNRVEQIPITSKVIIITGGTGGIGYQVALALAEQPAKHTIVVTGRSKDSAEKAVLSLKEAFGNDNIHYALADLKLQSGGRKETNGVDGNFSFNVVAPPLLTRSLIPSLKAPSPTGRVQIISGCTPFDTLIVDDWEATEAPVGVPAYSVTKRVMEWMVVALSRKLVPQGIAVNVVGGALPGATSMASDIGFKDMPLFMKAVYPVLKMFVFKEDEGKSAKQCAQPVIWAALATSDELGTGRSLLSAPKDGKFKPEVASRENEDKLMSNIESKLMKD